MDQITTSKINYLANTEINFLVGIDFRNRILFVVSRHSDIKFYRLAELIPRPARRVAGIFQSCFAGLCSRDIWPYMPNVDRGGLVI